MKTPFFHNLRDYWRFYWPLAMLTFVTLLGNQLQVMILARYPDAVNELANLAVATAVFILFRSSLMFIPQLTNVYSHSTGSRRAVYRFVLILSAVSTLVFILVGWSVLGDWLLQWMFHRNEGDLPLGPIKEYCRWFTPILLLEGLRGYYMGLLIQNRKTGYVSVLNVFSLIIIAAFMYAGYVMNISPVTVVGGSQLASSVLTLLLTWLIYHYRYFQKEPADQDVPTGKELWKFFSPIMLTAYFLVLSRPILVAFAGRTENPEVLLAVSRVLFEISFFLVAPLNQFRNLYVTFGKIDLDGVRNFSILIFIGVVALMLIILLTPLSGFVFGTVYGLQDPVLSMVIQGTWVIILIPFILTVRNYYHGLCMIRKVTGRMGYAGIGRLVVIAIAAWWLADIGQLNQWTLPGILVLGFLVETIAIAWQFISEKRKRL